jgi:hypothetical protein
VVADIDQGGAGGEGRIGSLLPSLLRRSGVVSVSRRRARRIGKTNALILREKWVLARLGANPGNRAQCLLKKGQADYGRKIEQNRNKFVCQVFLCYVNS